MDIDTELDDYDDTYLADYDHGFGEEIEWSYSEIFDCLHHSYRDAFRSVIAAMIVVNIVLKLILYGSRVVNARWRELFGRPAILLAGLSLIFYHFAENIYLALIFLVFSVGGLFLLNFESVLRNSSIWIYVFTAIALNEYAFHYISSDLVKLRVFLMCSSMKLISLRRALKKLTIDEDRGSPGFMKLVTYLYHPESLPLGGYFPPKLDQTIEDMSRLTYIGKSITSMIIALIFLGFSDCLVMFGVYGPLDFFSSLLMEIFPSSISQMVVKIILFYCTALQFRASHYFVCFLIQSCHYFWGNDIVVAKPTMIEFPRSLVDVVIAWDIPMHLWLKENIFIPFKYKFGFAPSIFLTYAISSYIHGFRFEIWSVLLSLGLLTWIENKIRAVFAHSFDACLGAKACSYLAENRTATTNLGIIFSIIKSKIGLGPALNPECTRHHKYTPYNSKLVILINFGFSLLAIFHLAYLGSSFDLSEESSSIKHVLSTWSDMGYYSHKIGIMTIIFYFIIK